VALHHVQSFFTMKAVAAMLRSVATVGLVWTPEAVRNLRTVATSRLPDGRHRSREAVQKWRLMVEDAMRRDGSAVTPEFVSALDAFVAGSAAAKGMDSYSIMVGDESGTRYFTRSDDGSERSFHPVNVSQNAGAWSSWHFRASDPKEPLPIFSAGKWITAAALGAAVQAGRFRWEDKVSRFISWWTKNESDTRSHITFQHLLSHTSGLTASTDRLHDMGYSDGVIDDMNHVDVGLFENSMTLEEAAMDVYNASANLIAEVPAHFYYDETHYIIAEYAALQATGIATWQLFVQEYFGDPLGLQWQTTDSAASSTGHMFKEGSSTYTYGFWTQDLESGELIFGHSVEDPIGGCQMIASACLFSRFLTTYMGRGDNLFGANVLDQSYVRLEPGRLSAQYPPAGDEYALGHWINSGLNITHSVGSGSTMPIIATAPTGKKFWIHIQQMAVTAYEVTAMVNQLATFEFLQEVLPALYDLMASPPPVNEEMCI
jgi:CubicO group peptidase (beta-lactamase class C family)